MSIGTCDPHAGTPTNPTGPQPGHRATPASSYTTGMKAAPTTGPNTDTRDKTTHTRNKMTNARTHVSWVRASGMSCDIAMAVAVGAVTR
ncbi:hypothetical protein GCM10010401_07590 [Rarobacter faecitabidus]